MTNENYKYELAIRMQAVNNFLLFIKYTKPDFIINWHHKLLADKLNAFANGEIKKLMIFLPPQVGKSEMSTRRLPAFILGKNPNCKIAICGYNDTFAKKFNRQIQRIIDNNLYRNIFPKTLLNAKNVVTDSHNNYVRNSEEFEVMNYQGSLKAVGIGKGITGNPVDIGIIDDPIKGAEYAYSITYRNKLWDWYETEFETRLHNGSQQLITLTRWHQDDLAGRILLRDNDWEVISIAGIRELNLGYDGDPRQVGEALWPERHSLERYEKVKKQSPKVFASLYQQRPAPDGGLIWQTNFIEIDDELFPDKKHFTQYGSDWDLAYTKDEGNAASAYVTAGKIKNDIYIDDIGFDWLEFPPLIRWMKTKAAPHFIEAKASGKSAKQTLVSNGVPAIEVNVTKGDKEARARMASVYVDSGMVYIRKSLVKKLYYDANQGILNFPNNPMKDLSDALSQSILRLSKAGRLVVSTTTNESMLDELDFDD